MKDKMKKKQPKIKKGNVLYCRGNFPVSQMAKLLEIKGIAGEETITLPEPEVVNCRLDQTDQGII